jgi:hypothetical protein
MDVVAAHENEGAHKAIGAPPLPPTAEAKKDHSGIDGGTV